MGLSEDPFDAMERRMARIERRMEEMLEEALRPTWSLTEKALEPLYHVEEMEKEVVVTADLPCVRDKEDLEINCTGTTLEITARMCQTISFRKWGTVQRDADFECYRKLIPLPAEVDPEKAEAKLKDGILSVRLPKRVRRHRIRIA